MYSGGGGRKMYGGGERKAFSTAGSTSANYGLSMNHYHHHYGFRSDASNKLASNLVFLLFFGFIFFMAQFFIISRLNPDSLVNPKHHKSKYSAVENLNTGGREYLINKHLKEHEIALERRRNLDHEKQLENQLREKKHTEQGNHQNEENPQKEEDNSETKSEPSASQTESSNERSNINSETDESESSQVQVKVTQDVNVKTLPNDDENNKPMENESKEAQTKPSHITQYKKEDSNEKGKAVADSNKMVSKIEELKTNDDSEKKEEPKKIDGLKTDPSNNGVENLSSQDRVNGNELNRGAESQPGEVNTNDNKVDNKDDDKPSKEDTILTNQQDNLSPKDSDTAQLSPEEKVKVVEDSADHGANRIKKDKEADVKSSVESQQQQLNTEVDQNPSKDLQPNETHNKVGEKSKLKQHSSEEM